MENKKIKCEICKKEVTKDRKTQKYCSKNCANKASYIKNKESISKARKERYNNDELYREEKLIRNMLHYIKNKDKYKEKASQRYIEKKDEILSKNKEWYEKNKSRVRKKESQRRKKKRALIKALSSR